MSKFQNKANGSLTEAVRLTEAKTVHTDTGEVKAEKGFWVVNKANGSTAVIDDVQFNKEYLALPIEKASEPPLKAVRDSELSPKAEKLYPKPDEPELSNL